MSYIVGENLVHELLHFPQNIERVLFPSAKIHTHNDTGYENKGISSIPVDILDAPKEYIFSIDVPGLSKTDIQVTVERDNTLVIRSSGKRKWEDGEEEGCKCIRLERKASPKFLRKLRLPDHCNFSTISAKCENGVLTVTVEKLPPPPKAKTVEVAIHREMEKPNFL